jgi:tRNA(Leu) C34 or U34 (ribose-2'-O)-methylase TrmL
MNNEMKDIKYNKHPNASSFKMKNKRATVFMIGEESIGIELIVASDNHKERAVHKVLKGKAVLTGLKISNEAALCVYVGLRDILFKRGII